jgi:hypothetical protein
MEGTAVLRNQGRDVFRELDNYLTVAAFALTIVCLQALLTAVLPPLWSGQQQFKSELRLPPASQPPSIGQSPL